MSNDRLLIRGGHVLSMDAEVGVVPDCNVLIEDGVIVAIKPGLESSDAEVIDATGTVVMPGFIDTHRHLWQTVIRGELPSCTLDQYFHSVMFDRATAFSADDVYAGGLAGALDALNAGITTVVDWCNCTNTPEHADAAIAALRDSGIRAVFAYGWPGGPEWLLHSTLIHPDDARRARSQYFASDDGLLTFALGLRGPVSVDADTNRADFALARELGAPITVHAGMRITGIDVHEVEILERDGLLGSDITFVHANEMPDSELDAIAASGGTVSLAPYTEQVMGHGPPPTMRLLARGIRPGLSADVVTTVPGDMFTQMRSALAHGRIGELPTDYNVPFTPSLDAMSVLRFATIDGAAVCGLADRTGSLTPGKDADIVMMRTDMINTIPASDPVAVVVSCADTSNVDTVFVRGRMVKQAGRLLEVDMRHVRKLVESSRNSVLGKDADSQHGTDPPGQ